MESKNFAPSVPDNLIDLRNETQQREQNREALLRSLLDQPTEIDGEVYAYGNYEFARDSGLFDVFYYDPDTGEDSLVHVLAGDKIESDDGAVVVAGFHHEPSALKPETYVDMQPLEGKTARQLRDFQRRRFEPYHAHVVVEGYPKTVLRKDDAGVVEVSRTQSSMFPVEYDALAVMQAIRLARETRDKSLDKPGADSTIIAEGQAPLLDGENTMSIRLILDAETEKVITAIPLPKRKGIMGLEPEEVGHHLGIV